MKLGEFRYDHTPILTIYSDYIDTWHSKGSHEELLEGKLDEIIISMFSDEALEWAKAVVKNYTKDPQHYTRRTDLYQFFHTRLRYEKGTIKVLSYGKIKFSSKNLLISDASVFDLKEKIYPFEKNIKTGNHELKLYFNQAGECLIAEVVFENETPTDFEIAKTKFDVEHHNGAFSLTVFTGCIFLCGTEELTSFSEFFKKEENLITIKNTAENSPFNIENLQPGIIPIKIKEGVYSCFWGMNKNSKIISFIVDFGGHLN